MIIIILICVYKPSDNMQINDCSMAYEYTLNQIDMVIQAHPNSDIILCGDFNTSFQRNNAYTINLNEFLVRSNLCIYWNSVKSDN